MTKQESFNATAVGIAHAYKLPPRLCDALSALYAVAVVPPGEIDAVIIHRLRRELKQFGIAVKARRGVGYWLPDEHKRHMRQAISSI